jgi:hypothetical protein
MPGTAKTLQPLKGYLKRLAITPPSIQDAFIAAKVALIATMLLVLFTLLQSWSSP